MSPGNNRKTNDTVLFFPSGTILKFFLMTHLSHVGRVAFFCGQILNFTIASISGQREYFLFSFENSELLNLIKNYRKIKKIQTKFC